VHVSRKTCDVPHCAMTRTQTGWKHFFMSLSRNMFTSTEDMTFTMKSAPHDSSDMLLWHLNRCELDGAARPGAPTSERA